MADGHKLIITIVNKGDGEDVIEASKKAGASGGTITHGRGSGVQDTLKFFGLVIDPEKEIVMTLVENGIAKRVCEAIVNDMGIEKPGKGICFTLDVPKVYGLLKNS